MLKIKVDGTELFDEEKNEFMTTESTELEFEHSLFTLSLWESKWEKPFLGPEEKTTEETMSYIKIMCQTPNIDDSIFNRLSQSNVDDINRYIQSKMTATWFKEIPGERRGSREIITAEIIYYWMIALQVPTEYDRWHLNKLFTLLRVLNQKNQPAKKMSKREAMAQQRALNAQRLKQMNTTG